MQTLYKLTTSDNKTRKGEDNECQWGPNITHSGTGKGELCGPGYIHAYTDPLLAVFLNPAHAAITNPNLWECSGTIAKTDKGLKVGCVTLTTLKQIPLPEVARDQKIKFAILCALEIPQSDKFKQWAANWLSGKDRTEKAAAAASAADAYAASAASAAYADADAAAYAAAAAASAAYAYAAYAWKEIDLIAIARKAMEP